MSKQLTLPQSQAAPVAKFSNEMGYILTENLNSNPHTFTTSTLPLSPFLRPNHGDLKEGFTCAVVQINTLFTLYSDPLQILLTKS